MRTRTHTHHVHTKCWFALPPFHLIATLVFYGRHHHHQQHQHRQQHQRQEQHSWPLWLTQFTPSPPIVSTNSRTFLSIRAMLKLANVRHALWLTRSYCDTRSGALPYISKAPPPTLPPANVEAHPPTCIYTLTERWHVTRVALSCVNNNSLQTFAMDSVSFR